MAMQLAVAAQVQLQRLPLEECFQSARVGIPLAVHPGEAAACETGTLLEVCPRLLRKTTLELPRPPPARTCGREDTTEQGRGERDAATHSEPTARLTTESYTEAALVRAACGRIWLDRPQEGYLPVSIPGSARVGIPLAVHPGEAAACETGTLLEVCPRLLRKTTLELPRPLAARTCGREDTTEQGRGERDAATHSEPTARLTTESYTEAALVRAACGRIWLDRPQEGYLPVSIPGVSL
ncbi:UNVERIFIED_CONTAM: hypothetical protein FKN15_030902 [Acipenser sinensis]